jgi:hypothetical protein
VLRLIFLLTACVLASADVRDCACDLANAESMAARECSLCKEAEGQPPDSPVFFLKDINPRKPNRWLALPRAHTHALGTMSPEARLALWTATIEKAQQLWGNDWGLAVNGDERRTQCHGHIHIGKLVDTTENSDFIEVDSLGDIPIPKDGSGFWVHPAGKKLHVHSGEQVTEFVLMR